MSIKSDKWIRRMAQEHGMIEPFVERQIRGADDSRVISYGVSSYGYDVRCAAEFKVFTNIHSAVVDPKNFDEKSFVDINSDVCIIPPNSFALARTVEYFRIPRDVLTICLGKSTYARCGIIVNVTPTCRRRSTPTRAWRRCCSCSPTRPVRCPMPTVVASTRARPA
jgi:dCTP deaminase